MKKKKYAHIHWSDKYIDRVLLLGIVGGIILMAPGFIRSDFNLMFDIGNFLLLGVFIIDFGRLLAKSKGAAEFIKHHWWDVIVLVFFIFSFSSFFYLGLGRISWLVREERIATLFHRF